MTVSLFSGLPRELKSLFSRAGYWKQQIFHQPIRRKLLRFSNHYQLANWFKSNLFLHLPYVLSVCNYVSLWIQAAKGLTPMVIEHLLLKFGTLHLVFRFLKLLRFLLFFFYNLVSCSQSNSKLTGPFAHAFSRLLSDHRWYLTPVDYPKPHGNGFI